MKIKIKSNIYGIKVFELFSGTGSVGRVAKDFGYAVTSLDLKGADINIDILKWDYKIYEPEYFDIIWASPPCNTFSYLRRCNLWREGFTEERIQEDIENRGFPILRITEKIINYSKPL